MGTGSPTRLEVQGRPILPATGRLRRAIPHLQRPLDRPHVGPLPLDTHPNPRTDPHARDPAPALADDATTCPTAAAAAGDDPNIPAHHRAPRIAPLRQHREPAVPPGRERPGAGLAAAVAADERLHAAVAAEGGGQRDRRAGGAARVGARRAAAHWAHDGHPPDPGGHLRDGHAARVLEEQGGVWGWAWGGGYVEYDGMNALEWWGEKEKGGRERKVFLVVVVVGGVGILREVLCRSNYFFSFLGS